MRVKSLAGSNKVKLKKKNVKERWIGWQLRWKWVKDNNTKIVKLKYGRVRKASTQAGIGSTFRSSQSIQVRGSVERRERWTG